tara:strand:- start:5322 stop:6764 length:1443 start_codon:yes stop_codon:yes gene_type:complete
MNISDKNKIIPVILCGGSGTRLWPMSRLTYPKQFLNCNPFSDNTFLQDTQLRLNKINNISNPIIICNAEHRFIVAEQMREINIEPKAIILEPEGKNTTPAVTLAAIKSLEFSKDPTLLILPADHSIQDNDSFKNSIEKGKFFAENSQIVTFGILPTKPETGFGYIEAEDYLDFKNTKGSKIKRFIEKPNLKKAKNLIQDKKYSWNSGIFLVKGKTILKEVKKFEPDIYSLCFESLNPKNYDLSFQRLKEDIFKKCKNISLDDAIMEKTDLGYVIPLHAKWNDVGSWDSLWEISEKDIHGNTKSGNIYTKKAKNCYINSESRLVVGIDIEDLIIVDTDDALLIARRNSSQEVKNIVSQLLEKNITEAKQQKKVFRPWGNYISIANGLNWQVKKISVKQGASISLQKHNFRAEHWIVVSGVATVEVGKVKKILNKNESTFIPLGQKHRLSNKHKELLTIIEVQSGSYLGEDDIIRFKDDYGR